MKTIITICAISLFLCQKAWGQDTDTTSTDIGIFNLAAYDSLRSEAISAFHNKDLKEAKYLLDTCYKLNDLDTMITSLLKETLIMHLNTQKNPTTNLKDIKVWQQQYSFIADDMRVQHVKVQDAVQLGMKAFDKGNIKLATNYCHYILNVMEQSEAKNVLKNIANVNSLIYNTALKLYYDKDKKTAHTLFSKGARYYPKDENMVLMNKVSTPKN